MGKEICNLTFTREDGAANQNWGFRIIGGTDQGQTYKVEKVLTGYPASYGGLKVHDFLISVNGQEVFDMNHPQLVKLIKTSGNTMELAVERGDFIVPNFEEIWPSGKKKETGPPKVNKMDYILEAMQKGIPGNKDAQFSTVGKPRVTVNQYDNPINCYSEDTLNEMTESSGTWAKTDDQVAAVVSDPAKFPNATEVLTVIADSEKGIGIGLSQVAR